MVKWYDKRLFDLGLVMMILIFFFSGISYAQDQNQRPTVRITSGPNGVINVNTATFGFIGSDLDGRVTRYYYELDDVTPNYYTSRTRVTFRNIRPGRHTFYVKARDDDRAYSIVARRSFRYEIPNQAPTIRIISGPNAVINVNSATFTFEGLDADGQIAGYYYGFDNMVPDIFTQNISVIWQNIIDGEHTFYVKTCDDDNVCSAVASWSFRCEIPNQAPTIRIISGPNAVINENSAVFTFEGLDVDGEIIGYYYGFDDAGTNRFTQDMSVTWQDIVPGEHTFYIRSWDNEDTFSSIIDYPFRYDAPLPPEDNRSFVNILRNNSFEIGNLDSWEIENHRGLAQFTKDCSTAVDGSCSVRISNPQIAEVYTVQLKQAFHIERGVEYRFGFFAKASGNRNITIQVCQNYDPWMQAQIWREVSVTAEWSSYEFVFTSNVEDDRFRVSFLAGDNTGDVWVDNVTLMVRGAQAPNEQDENNQGQLPQELEESFEVYVVEDVSVSQPGEVRIAAFREDNPPDILGRDYFERFVPVGDSITSNVLVEEYFPQGLCYVTLRGGWVMVGYGNSDPPVLIGSGLWNKFKILASGSYNHNGDHGWHNFVPVLGESTGYPSAISGSFNQYFKLRNIRTLEYASVVHYSSSWFERYGQTYGVKGGPWQIWRRFGFGGSSFGLPISDTESAGAERVVFENGVIEYANEFEFSVWLEGQVIATGGGNAAQPDWGMVGTFLDFLSGGIERDFNTLFSEEDVSALTKGIALGSIALNVVPVGEGVRLGGRWIIVNSQVLRQVLLRMPIRIRRAVGGVGRIRNYAQILINSDIRIITDRLMQNGGVRFSVNKARDILMGHSPFRYREGSSLNFFPLNWTEEEILTAIKNIADQINRVGVFREIYRGIRVEVRILEEQGIKYIDNAWPVY